MRCAYCGHMNTCPNCNGWLCDVCGEELPPRIPDDNDYGYVQKLNEARGNQNGLDQ